MFNRILLNIKQRSNETLRAWSYQCESILAQRSRRIQQLLTFYHRVYGPTRFEQLLRAYRKQLQPPIRGIMLSAVGMGLGMNFDSNNNNTNTTTKNTSSIFNWAKERLSLKNFDICHRDIEFIETLSRNKLCDLCKEKQMKYCYCQLGNKKCRPSGGGPETIRGCRTPLGLQSEEAAIEGIAVIEAADESKWEPYLSKDEFSIWRREERTAMYSYKVYARFDDITAQDLLHVQTDLNYRCQWDQTAVALKTIDEDPLPGTNSHLIYWEMQWPKFFSNRDYVYCRRFLTDEKHKVMLICSRGTKHPDYPVLPNKVRVTDYWSLMVIKPYRNFYEPGVHFILTYYDDPGLPIPQSIKSWVTQKQMPDFLHKMYQATKQYSCKRAIEMKHLLLMETFEITNNDYTANVARESWIRRMMWKQREKGK